MRGEGHRAENPHGTSVNSRPRGHCPAARGLPLASWVTLLWVSSFLFGCAVFVTAQALSLVAVSRGCLWLWSARFSLWWLLLKSRLLAGGLQSVWPPSSRAEAQ